MLVQSMRDASAIMARIDRRFASRKSNSGTDAAAPPMTAPPPEDAALWGLVGPETSAVDGDDGELLRSARLDGVAAAAVAQREEAALLRMSSNCCTDELTCPTRSSS